MPIRLNTVPYITCFRATGRRYQSRINAALREYVTAQKKAV
jgi:uncharacterized protein (DUF4415 family)